MVTNKYMKIRQTSVEKEMKMQVSVEVLASNESHAYEEIRSCNRMLGKRGLINLEGKLTSATSPGDLKRLTNDHIESD